MSVAAWMIGFDDYRDPATERNARHLAALHAASTPEPTLSRIVAAVRRRLGGERADVIPVCCPA